MKIFVFPSFVPNSADGDLVVTSNENHRIIHPVILGGLFANGKDMGRCLPMLNHQRNNKML